MSLDFTAAVSRAKAGDADAFAELYSLVYKELYRIALLNLHNEHDASDVVSDTVLDAYSSIASLRDVRAFKSWIIKILSAKIKKKWKENRKITDYRQDIDDLDEKTEQKTAKEINFNGLEVIDGFKQLSEEERLILSLSVVSGYTSEDIADMLGTNPNTVRSKAARAKTKLKAMMT